MAIDDVPRRRRGRRRILGRGRQPPLPRRPWHWARVAGVTAAIGGYSWVAGTAKPFTPASFIGVLIPGLALGAVAWLWPPERIPAPERLDIAGASYWVIAVAALLEWEASAFADNSLPWHPSLTDLINPLLAPHPVKSAAIAVWLGVGWALVRR